VRILHTTDWHAGKTLRGVRRTPEIRRVLQHLAATVEEEAVDLVLVTGDLFDTRAPSAAAERAVYEFFLRASRAGAVSVVIAGNHDSGERLEAWGQLASLAGVHTLGRPRPADAGGVIEMTLGGEPAVIAALPFASPRTLVSALDITRGDAGHRAYAARMAEAIEHLCARFRGDAVNLLLAHTSVEGALFSGSERRVHVTQQWSMDAAALPPEAHYIGLGHLHRPQWVRAAPAPTRYAGSPVQMDFGEVAEEKRFVLIDAAPGRPASIALRPYTGGVPLVDLAGSLDEVVAAAGSIEGEALLRVTVTLGGPDADLGRRVRKALPNALVVRAKLPDAAPYSPPAGPARGPGEQFADYYRLRHGREPPDALLEAFGALHREANS